MILYHFPLMKRIYLLFFLLGFFSIYASAQFTKYVIRFKDKAGTPFTIDNPSAYLSAKAIARRTKQNITIDETDLPITPRYIDSVRLSGAVTILNKSKWLNQVCIQTTDSLALVKINSLPFVIASQPVMQPVGIQNTRNDKFNEETNSITSSQGTSNVQDFYNYGNSYPQIHIHEGEYLHDKGFHGEGMSVAILDAGFYHYLSLPAFDNVRNNNQVKETYDYVANEVSVDEDHFHGMMCFSIMAGNIPGQLVGSSPKANYYLYRTEDVSTESPVEEQNWAAAAERADSIGIDVISTSLGYNQFDNPVFNHTYADMNGNSTIAARAADFAAKKGMIVVVAAGNEGNHAWHFITTPADADSVVAVGAVNSSGVIGSFSSYGPSSDGQVKPAVASVGVGTAVSSTTGPIVTGNGTSFAAPNLAGLITCLWQAFPEFTNMEIIQAVEKSSSIYNAPDDRIGYGIPNFRIAYDDLSQQRALKNINTILGSSWIKVYPNPFKDNFNVAIKPPHAANGIFRLYDAFGRLYFTRQISLQAEQDQLIQFNNLQPLQRGIYMLKFNDGQSKESIKLLAQ
ncbi:S8 family serine peptidase [Ginsengibacter hankyongi]|uniref:S8 family serine peptidase n=2 Tax=Ginsengibacter hankyongi TaxID=2607284 RepID=A0A5J5IKR7_9BACT|nr:S8 family serine peptidase [Ginsengibacter hankyongi]